VQYHWKAFIVIFPSISHLLYLSLKILGMLAFFIIFSEFALGIDQGIILVEYLTMS